MSSSSQDPISTGRLVALSSSKNRLNQETFSVNSSKSLLGGNGDHMLAEAKSELMK